MLARLLQSIWLKDVFELAYADADHRIVSTAAEVTPRIRSWLDNQGPLLS